MLLESLTIPLKLSPMIIPKIFKNYRVVPKATHRNYTQGGGHDNQQSHNFKKGLSKHLNYK